MPSRLFSAWSCVWSEHIACRPRYEPFEKSSYGRPVASTKLAWFDASVAKC
uniref:Uncharacterized protein n=1 Tax=Arundo donax TaxID=35708 RepID=A0A0A9EI09_ARUDO